MATKNRFATLRGMQPQLDETVSDPNTTKQDALPELPPLSAVPAKPTEALKPGPGRRPLGKRKVAGGKARNADYEPLTVYLPPKVKKQVRYYLHKDEDISEILEEILIKWIAQRKAQEDN